MVQAATFSYNDQLFRTQFPAFDNSTAFPLELLQMYWDQSGTIVQNTTYGFLACQGGPMALNLMTAHLAAISVLIGSGENPGVVVSASIDKISVTLEPPPYKTQFMYWLGTTPYGQQLLALLQAASVGGFAVPGSLGRAGFAGNGFNQFW